MLVGDAAARAVQEAARAAAKSSKWKGIEMIILRSSIQNMIQMSIFEYTKTYINDMQFSDGRTALPAKEKREKK